MCVSEWIDMRERDGWLERGKEARVIRSERWREVRDAERKRERGEKRSWASTEGERVLSLSLSLCFDGKHPRTCHIQDTAPHAATAAPPTAPNKTPVSTPPERERQRKCVCERHGECESVRKSVCERACVWENARVCETLKPTRGF